MVLIDLIALGHRIQMAVKMTLRMVKMMNNCIQVETVFRKDFEAVSVSFIVSIILELKKPGPIFQIFFKFLEPIFIAYEKFDSWNMYCLENVCEKEANYGYHNRRCCYLETPPTAGRNLDFFYPHYIREINKVVFKKTLSCNTPAKLNTILFAQHTLAVIRAFHTA